jgi:hypothetical protein
MLTLLELLLIMVRSWLLLLLKLVEANASKPSSQAHCYTWKHTSWMEITVVVDWRLEVWLLMLCMNVILLFSLLAS